MTTHRVSQYRGDTGRQRWAVLATPANVWYFPTRYGYKAAGFGISTQYQDSRAETDLIVDVYNRTVKYLSKEWSFADFVSANPQSWDEL